MTQADRLQKIRPMSRDDRDALLGAAATDRRHAALFATLAKAGLRPYLSAQLGHSSPATTLRYYAKWIPSKGRRWVNSLDRRASRDGGIGAAKPTTAYVEPESGTSAKGTAASV